MNLFKPFFINSTIILFSRILSFVRDMLIATTFGAIIETDAFFVAFKIPNILRKIFAEGAFSQTFIPMLTEYKNKKKFKKTRFFISYISGMLSLMLILIIIIGIILSPEIIFITSPKFYNNPELFHTTVILLRIMFPYVFFVSLACMASSILNVWNYFFLPAISPIFLNFSIIFFVIFLHSYFKKNIFCLAWGVLIGGIIQFLYQLPKIQQIHMLPYPVINIKNKKLTKMLKGIIPAIFGVAFSQLSTIINIFFSSILDSGSISWIYYADRLLEFPTSVLGISLGTILLPVLTKNVVKNDFLDYKKNLDWGLRLSFILGLPSSLLLYFLAKPLVISLFQYGNFNDFDTFMTKNTVESYSIGIIGLILVKILSSSFFSLKDFTTPMKCSLLTIIINTIINIFFIYFFKHVGLAISVSISSWINAFLLYNSLYSSQKISFTSEWWQFLLKLFISTLVMKYFISIILYNICDWRYGSMIFRIFRITGTIIISWITYLITFNMLNYYVFNRKKLL